MPVSPGFQITPSGFLYYNGVFVGEVSLTHHETDPDYPERYEFVARGLVVYRGDGRGRTKMRTIIGSSTAPAMTQAEHNIVQNSMKGQLP